MREGEDGDRSYVVADGELESRVDDGRVPCSVAATASARSRCSGRASAPQPWRSTAGRLYALDSEAFLSRSPGTTAARARPTSWSTASGGCRDRGRIAAVIDPLDRWREYGEKPDFAGLLTFGGPRTRRTRRARGFRRRDRRGADRRPRLGPAGHALRPARDPRGELPARAAPRGGDRRLRRAADGRLRRRARAARRPGALPRRDRGDRRRRCLRPARSRSSSAATTRSPSRTSARARRVHGPVGLIHFDTHTDTGTRGLRRRDLARHADVPPRRGRARRPEALRADRPARLLARRRRSSRGRPSTGSRASSCTTCASSGSRRVEQTLAVVGDGRRLPLRRRRRARPRVRARDRHARAGRHDLGRAALGRRERSPRGLELVGADVVEVIPTARRLGGHHRARRRADRARDHDRDRAPPPSASK